ncbi:MAG TPA: hypothetical protein VJ201_07765 [Candidatus Babeliales bacterium]|nr:hypothetical protein [Candidatus Babeliales bacterium]HLC07004.1 hypothetical protein [Candidatus Babeliales bacterium]
MALTPVSLLELCKYTSLVCSSLITLFLTLHDWIDIYPLNDLATFNKHCSLRNKILMTIINTPFFIIYTALLLYYWSTPISSYAAAYLIICNLLFFTGIMFSWWLPYLFGFPASQVEDLHKSHGTTHTFLPTIGNNPTPDTLHVIFHLVFVLNVIATFIVIYS